MNSLRLRELIRLGVSDPWPVYFKDAPSAPRPPDYVGAAEAQGEANVEAARVAGKLANPNYTTPLGSRNVEFGVNGDPDRVSVTESLTPQGQQRFDQEQRIIGNLGSVAESGLGRVGDAMSSPLDIGNAVELQDRAENAILSRLEPRLQRDEEALRARLANQGLSQGTGAAYSNEMERFSQSKNDARQQAVINALSTKPQTLQQDLAIRQIPLNELNALRTGSQVQLPQFQQYQGQNVQPAPFFGATQAGRGDELDIYNAEVGSVNAANSNTASGIGAAAGIAAMFF